MGRQHVLKVATALSRKESNFPLSTSLADRCGVPEAESSGFVDKAFKSFGIRFNKYANWSLHSRRAGPQLSSLTGRVFTGVNI